MQKFGFVKYKSGLLHSHRMKIADAEFRKNRQLIAECVGYGMIAVLGKVFGPERREMAEGWRRLHNEGFHNLYRSPSIICVI